MYRILLLLFALYAPCALAQPWLLIDTERLTLSVMEGNKVKKVYRNIAIGRGGVTEERKRGDGKTPKGVFHVVRIEKKTPFRLFFGLDYPNRAHAERAFRRGIIDRFTLRAIERALRMGRMPPADTPLGGNIGIHGLGNADPRIHQALNWTQGCIALTNAQIEDLSAWVRLGTRVVIR
ncbi:MAG: L,D-transpeptidase [Gammaproteobacteria bacterium]|nr:MAG: L,D-transpeptidase [Gammaproteobacteria bacterium]